jgi:hypothetical protein
VSNDSERLLTSEEFVAALRSPVPLLEQPVLQEILRAEGCGDLLPPPKFTLLQGGRDAS